MIETDHLPAMPRDLRVTAVPFEQHPVARPAAASGPVHADRPDGQVEHDGALVVADHGPWPHGRDEALLAVGFIFTVHFFNNHWRPDKFPLDILMFTGRMPLEEFKREHAIDYQRLVESNQLDNYLVDAPTHPMTVGSKILGFTLMACGLILLYMVISGFIGRLAT